MIILPLIHRQLQCSPPLRQPEAERLLKFLALQHRHERTLRLRGELAALGGQQLPDLVLILLGVQLEDGLRPLKPAASAGAS